jgi:hypothetical protein
MIESDDDVHDHDLYDDAVYELFEQTTEGKILTDRIGEQIDRAEAEAAVLGAAADAAYEIFKANAPKSRCTVCGAMDVDIPR